MLTRGTTPTVIFSLNDDEDKPDETENDYGYTVQIGEI